MRHQSRSSNWPLVAGSVLVGITIILSIVGPLVAPHDPLARTPIVRLGERWISAPIPAFAVPEFPLGTDQYGRDLLSRLLWGIYPTLILVFTLVVIRVAVGFFVGVLLGWSSGWLSRILHLSTSGALALPVLIVALFAIPAIGYKRGLLAFAIGLGLTGWAETARLVAEQTRITRGRQYVEAARALGASDLQIITSHVVRQILPLLWVLFVHEASTALSTTAELGFLGFYIGGDYLVQVLDTTSARTLGRPELGQMLASAYREMFNRPMGIIATGTVIAVTLLGLNLLGEGLRRRLELYRSGTLLDLDARTRRLNWLEVKAPKALPEPPMTVPMRDPDAPVLKVL